MKIIILGILLAPFFSFAQEYPILITEEGYIIVKVNLADSISGNFILDTGAGANVVSGKLFEKIQSKTTKAGYFTGFRHDGDRLDGEVYEIPYLAIGAVKQTKPIVGVYPPLDDFGIDGLLSLKFFETRSFTIDYQNKKLIFPDSQELKSLNQDHTILPISIYKHTNVMLDIFIPIQLNDSIRMLAEFDTGSGFGAYIINPHYIKVMGLDTTKAITQAYTTQISGEKRTDTICKLASVSVGKDSKQIKRKNINAIFREGLIYNALIGSGLFKDHKITIDIPNKVFVIHH